MLDIREISLDELLSNEAGLFAAHREEVALNKDVMILKPNIIAYKSSEENGLLLIVGVFDDGKLIGYSVNFVMRHHHYMDLICCQNDLLFVDKDYRKGRTGIRLMKATKDFAAMRNAQLVFWRAKPNTSLEKLMRLKKLPVQETVFYERV